MVVSDVTDSKVTVTLLSMISLRALSLCYMYLLRYKSTLNAVKYLIVTLTFNMGLVSLLYSPDHFLPEGTSRLSIRLVIL